MHKRVALDSELDNLALALVGVRNANEMRDFLHAMLTPRERENIVLRWKLVKMLEAGMQQRVISEKLGVSLCKITRGSRELKKGPKGFRAIVKRAATGS